MMPARCIQTFSSSEHVQEVLRCMGFKRSFDISLREKWNLTHQELIATVENQMNKQMRDDMDTSDKVLEKGFRLTCWLSVGPDRKENRSQSLLSCRL